MASEPDVAQGVGTAELAAFAEHAVENPEQVQLGLNARSTYEGTCAHSPTTVDSDVLGAEQIDRYTSSVEAAGFSVTDVRENDQYEFISDRAANGCETYGVESVAVGATR